MKEHHEPTHGVCDVCSRVIALRKRLRTGKPIKPYKLVQHKLSDRSGSDWCHGGCAHRVIYAPGYNQ